MMNTKFNKIIHLLFVLYGFYLVFIQKDYSNATLYIGLALAFDPFNVNQAFNDRAFWQKSILFIELILILFLIINSMLTALKS